MTESLQVKFCEQAGISDDPLVWTLTFGLTIWMAWSLL